MCTILYSISNHVLLAHVTVYAHQIETSLCVTHSSRLFRESTVPYKSSHMRKFIVKVTLTPSNKIMVNFLVITLNVTFMHSLKSYAMLARHIPVNYQPKSKVADPLFHVDQREWVLCFLLSYVPSPREVNFEEQFCNIRRCSVVI